MTAPFESGDVLLIHEPDYLYGIGDLRLRVMAVSPVQRLIDGDWYVVAGMCLAWNGTELGQRQVLVRATAMCDLRRPPEAI